MVKTLLKKIIFWPTSPFINHLIGELIFRFKGRRQAARNIDLSQVKQLLVIRLDQIGDLVMTTPFLRELRRNVPDAWITLVVLPTVFNLVENCPYVNEVLACDWTGDRDLYRFHRHWRAFKFARKYFQHKQFDLAILPRRDTDQAHGAFLAYFSGAPVRVGYSDISFGQKLSYFRNTDCLLTHVIKDHNSKHEVEYNLDVIRFIGGKVESEKLEIWRNTSDEFFAEHLLRANKVRHHELLIGFAIGASHPRKMWPLINFIEIGKWLKRKYNARIVLMGGSNERLLGNKIELELGITIINSVGQTTLRQTGGILKHCQLYVGNDTGAMHLAAALSIPVVEICCHSMKCSLNHSGSSTRFGPWGISHQILQPKKAIPPCSDVCMAQEAHCICDVTVEQVKEAIAYLLSNQSRSNVH